MARDFYGEFRDEVVKKAEPLVPEFIKNNSEINTTTLPNGNSIMEPVSVTEWIGNLRKKLINNKEYVQAEIETQKSAARNEVSTIKQYWKENVFSEPREMNQQFVTASVLALGAWFTGSILTSKKNWGFQSPWTHAGAGVLQRNPTVFSKILTSLPVRLTLPWILAGSVYSQLTPKTWGNAVQSFERDVLPQDFVQQYHSFWNETVQDGLKKQLKGLKESAHESLQSGIGSIRETIAESLNYNFKDN